MRRLVAPLVTVLAACSVHANGARVPDPLVNPVEMRDVRYTDANDLAPQVARSPTRIELPFTLVWNGRRYSQLEVGPGWARATVAGEISSGSGLLAVASGRGAESPTAVPGPLFEVLAGEVTLGPHARVLVDRSPAEVAIRWWDLRAAKVPGSLAAELLIDRIGQVRFQYLQVHPLSPLLESVGGRVTIGISGGGAAATRLLVDGQLAPGFELKNGFAILLTSPDERPLARAINEYGSMQPPPPDCLPAATGWCSIADGPTADASIFLDTRFEEPIVTWTASGDWHIIPDTVCPPGAVNVPGNSAYVGVDATCTWNPGTHQLNSPPFGPVTPNTMFTFSARAKFPSAQGSALILVNGVPTWSIDPTPLNGNAWYNFLPLSLGAYAGQMVTLSYRFSANPPATDIGWMVDSVFVWDDNAAITSCVKNALYDNGSPTYADCSDTVHTNWAFNEDRFCAGCLYTFYALVECGTEMHLPLADMEGAEISIQQIGTAVRPSLVCENQTYRNPTAPPVVYSRECCAASPGPEQWTGPSWSATDNNGPGSVAWGFPSCSDVSTAYDLDMNGLSCAELVPGCGGPLTRISPGENQSMDCRINGSPGLCGVYRVDVRSGGFVWNLFANCVGDTLPGFRLFSSCADAWNAFVPLPELAIANAREVGMCPTTEIEFDVHNLGCADVATDFVVRATSNCPFPDSVDWTITGGLTANSTRTERRMITVSCAAATITLTLDPANALAECSESPTAAACAVIPGADSVQLGACGCAGTTPPLATADVVCEGTPTSLSCGVPEPGATYDWDFEDDSIFDATGCNVSYVYPTPGMRTARVRVTTSASCIADARIPVDVTADLPPTQSALIRGRKSGASGIHFEWTAVAASSYRVARGQIGTWYSHTVDDPIGVGQCDTLGLVTFDDPDDRSQPGNFYYLVAPLGQCGADGPWGLPGDPTPRPIPTTSCP